MYTRLLKGEEITLFSPSDVPGLYDAFFADQDEFERLYTKYEKDDSIRKQRVKAVDLFSLMMQERASTGRIYIQNVDHCNTHSPFDPVVAPVRQSNLCLEIALPTKPLEDVNDENGEIALCTLSAFNLGAIKSLDELEELAVLAAQQEKEWADYLFRDGSMIGLNKDILCQYVEYITNIRMQAVGLDLPFQTRSNPIPWINTWLVSDNVQVAPQEVEVSSYLVGQIDSEVNTDDLSDFQL